MENFSLQDLTIIIGSVVLFAAACFVMPPLFKYGPRFFVSLFRRYLWVDWDEFMSRLADVSGSEQIRTSSTAGSGGSGDLVLGHKHHIEPIEPQENEPQREPIARQLEKEELIITLAVQRNDKGDYLYSANQITAFVGGAAAPIKAIIANVRGKKETPAPAKNLQRPVNGW